MIQSIKLGKRVFATNIIQGPLAGVSCAPFRALTWRYGEPAYSCTEMLSCKTLLHQSEQATKRYTQKAEDEGPVSFQLSSNNPDELAEAVKRITDLKADLIDLNCGCPVQKIRRKGAGSSLLSDARRLYQMIIAMKRNTHLPVSIKIRVQGDTNEKFNAEIVKVVNDAGLDFLVVHGRHWTEQYNVACRYDQIQYFVESLSIPVIGNGDIACVSSLQKMFQTGCAGVMIGRAGVGQPWLIKQLSAEYRQQSFGLPMLNEVGDMLIEHVTRLVHLLESEKFALLQARTFAKYYARSLPDKMGYMDKVNICEKLSDFISLTQSYFQSV